MTHDTRKAIARHLIVLSVGIAAIVFLTIDGQATGNTFLGLLAGILAGALGVHLDFGKLK